MNQETIPPDEPIDEPGPETDPETLPEITPDAKPVKECALCGGPAPKEARAFVNRQVVCLTCRDQIEEELKAEHAGAVSMPSAIAGALLGALLGAVLWAVIVVVTDFEVGYVALAVGWLAGKGAVLGAAGKKGAPLQIVAVLCSVIGLALGKYFTLAHYIKMDPEAPADLSYFDPRIFEIFTENLGEMFGGFDILWLILAIGVAYRVPAPTQVSMSRRRGA